MFELKKKKLKSEIIIKYWSYLWFFRLNGTIIICEDLKKIKKELKCHQYKVVENYKFRNLIKKLNLKLILKNNWFRYEGVNIFFIIENWEEFLEVYKILEEKKIVMIGIYLKGILFYPKDLKLELIDKKIINERLLKKINLYYLILRKLIKIFKKLIIKINFLLNKKLLNKR